MINHLTPYRSPDGGNGTSMVLSGLALADVTDDAVPGVAIAKATGFASTDGCMNVTTEAYIEMESSAINCWWAYTGNGRGAQIVVKNRPWTGNLRMSRKVTGLTPGSANSFTLQHCLSQTATTGRIQAGSGTGHLLMTADPCSP